MSTRKNERPAKGEAPRGERAGRTGGRKKPAARRGSRSVERPSLAEGLAALRRRVRPLVLLAGALLCAYAAACLATYSPVDPSFLNGKVLLPGMGGVHNLGGPAGAHLADLLLQALGYGACAVLVLGVALGLRLAGRELGGARRVLGGAAGLWLLLCLLALIAPSGPLDAFPAGGLLGERSVAALRDVVGPAGTWLMVLGGLVAMLPILAGLDLETVASHGLRAAERAIPGVKRLSVGAVAGVASAGSAVAAGLRRPLLAMAERDRDLHPHDSDEGEEADAADDPDSLPPSQPFADPPPARGRARVRPAPVEPEDAFDAAMRPPDPEERTQIGQRDLVEVEWETTGLPPAGAARQRQARLGFEGFDRLPDPPPGMPAEPPGYEQPEDETAESDRSAADLPASPAARPARRGKAPAGPRLEVDEDALISGGSGGREGLAVVPRSKTDPGESRPFELPNLGLLDAHERDVVQFDEAELQELATTLESKLADFGVKGSVTAIRPGPVITTFEYLPAAGIKLSKIASLSDDIAMALKALRVRIVAPIPGKGVVGIEIPNKKRQTIWIRDLLASDDFRRAGAALPMVLGKGVEGRLRMADLSTMPHLLVGGTTGSGKSVGVNAMLLSMLFTRTPEELRMILIDPKTLEFDLYRDIPHLLHPVVVDPKLASAALKWACAEMDERYRALARWGTRNIESYNQKLEKERQDWTPAKARRYLGSEWPDSAEPGEYPGPPRPMPFIVIVIDELADLMMTAGKDVEESIIRLAQKARASGIHLIVATQRPSVNVITGLIKANMPCRVAYQVRTKVDGRTILDQNGAENLLGKGDMLYLPPGVSALERCHGPFVSDEEVRAVTDFLRSQGPPNYDADIRVEDDEDGEGPPLGEDEYDDLYDQAVAYVCRQGKASTSMIQREFKIGYNRAARMIEVMEREGLVGPADGARPRDVIAPSH